MLPLVSIRNIQKRFDNGAVALKDVCLDVNKGEFVSLLGPSGCGKSTALRIIAGLDTASNGEIVWSEGAAHANQADIGFVFQEPTLLPWATVFKNVWLPLRVKGISKKNAHSSVMQALETVGLQDYVHHTPDQLSGGMKMRVSIARALVVKPSVLLMDEPFAALDEITRFKLNDELMQLQEKFGWTILFVTHSVYEAAYLSSRVLLMGKNSGRIVSEIILDGNIARNRNFRSSPGYLEACYNISEALRSGIDAE